MNLFLKDTQNSINCIDNQNLIRTFYLKLRACLPYRLRLCCCFCLSYSRFCLWAVDFRAHFHWILGIFRSISCVQTFHVREDDPQFHFTSELLMLFPLQNKYSWNIHSLIYFLLKNMKMSKSSTTHTFTLILTVQFNRTIKLVKYLEQTQINTFSTFAPPSSTFHIRTNAFRFEHVDVHFCDLQFEKWFVRASEYYISDADIPKIQIRIHGGHTTDGRLP